MSKRNRETKTEPCGFCGNKTRKKKRNEVAICPCQNNAQVQFKALDPLIQEELRFIAHGCGEELDQNGRPMAVSTRFDPLTREFDEELDGEFSKTLAYIDAMVQ